MISSWAVVGFPFGFGVGSWHPREALQEAGRFHLGRWLGFPFGFGVGSWHPREAMQEARRFHLGGGLDSRSGLA